MTTAIVLVERRSLIRQALESMLAATKYAPRASVSSVDELDGGVTHEEQLVLLLSAETGEACCRDIRALKRLHPRARVIIVSEEFDLWSTFAALQAGASGQVLSTCTAEMLIGAIDLVLCGAVVVPGEFSQVLLAELQCNPYAPAPPDSAEPADEAGSGYPASTGAPSDPRRFSHRELEILACLAVGASNKDIAKRTSMAEATVKTHLKAILRKLGATNRTQAAVWALKHAPHLASIVRAKEAGEPEASEQPSDLLFREPKPDIGSG